MATGQSAQQGRGMVLTNITPGADTRTGEAEAWDAGTRLLTKYAAANKTNLIRRAQQRGAVEGAAVADGAPMPERGLMYFGDVAEARTAALQSAYVANTRTDFDAAEARVRQENRYDPEAYETAMAQVRSGFIQGAPPEYAVDVETYANEQLQRGLAAVSSARIARDDQEVVQALAVRHGKLTEDLVAMAANGTDPMSVEWLTTVAEHTALQDQREANPAVLYSTEQRIADDEKLLDGMMLATIGRNAVETYNDMGRGLAGYAAAARFLEEEVLNGEAFADVDPGRRAKMYRDAVTELRAFSTADREERRVAEEQERQRRAEIRAAGDSAVLDASLGEISEADILARTDLDDAQKSRALSARRAADSRARTEANAAAAMERAGQIEVYSRFRDDADAGLLSEAEIAEGLNAGLLLPGQAQTLRSRMSTVLKPIIDDVMAPSREASRRPGASMRDRDSNLARAEEAASIYARTAQAEGHTLEQRLAAGRAISDRFFGAGSNRPGPAASGGTEAQTTAARVRAVNAQIEARRAAGRPYSAAEANRMRNEAQGR